MTPVETWPITTLTAVTAISMMFIGSRSWASATAHTEGGCSPVIWFTPNWASCSAASAVVRPASASDPADATTSAASCANGEIEAEVAIDVSGKAVIGFGVDSSTRVAGDQREEYARSAEPVARPVDQQAMPKAGIADRQRVGFELREHGSHNAGAGQDDLGPLGLKPDDLAAFVGSSFAVELYLAVDLRTVEHGSGHDVCGVA